MYSEVKGIYGYRRMTLNVNSRLKRNYNHKRIYRLMKSVHMQAVIRRKKNHYVILEPRVTALVYPYIDREPNMVLIEARKGGNSRITVERPLIVYEKPGVYTSDILEIYGRV